ncbi:MAG TPA: response regulator [Paracoccaceae bacterium]
MTREQARINGASTTARASCLLAEDDEINQAIVEQFIATLGFVDLVIASDGREALSHCMERSFDLLIFDRKMPFLHGDKLIRHLRASNNPNSATPVILFSASSGAELSELGVLCPADLILPKPINKAGFLAAVRGLLEAPTAR